MVLRNAIPFGHERPDGECLAPTDVLFWERLDALVAGSRIVIDRVKGTAHPRYPDFIYPLDYGYLDGTRAIDGGGVDVWVGSLPERRVTAVVCTVDTVKRDTELKLLLPRLHAGREGGDSTYA